MKITEVLRAEHMVLNNLLDHVEDTVPRLKTLTEIKRLATLMSALLEAHGDAEDELVGMPMEHCLNHLGQLENFHEQHCEMDCTLQRVLESRSLTEARKFLLNAVNCTRKHFSQEERTFFPLAEKTLKRSTLETLGRAYLEKHKEIVLS